MAKFQATEFSFSDIHNGERYQNGDIVDAEAINKPIEAAAYAQEKAKRAEQVADNALQKINDVVVGEVTLMAYPIGSIYITKEAVDPAELFGGQWERIKDRFLLASGDKYAVGSDGGSADAVVVSHNHTFTTLAGSGGGDYPSPSATAGFNAYLTAETHSTGEDGTGKNMPPYKVVNIWHRYA